MKGLLTKDCYLLLQRKQTLILFVAISLLMGWTCDGSFLITYMCIFSAKLAIGTISYDDADNGMLFLLTLPADRSTYALSKYLLSWIVCGVAWAIGLVLMLILNTVKGIGIDPLNDLVISLSLIPMWVLALDVMIPIQLKFGAEKSRIAIAMLGGIVAALLLCGSQIVESFLNLGELTLFLSGVPLFAYILGGIMLTVALTRISISASGRIVQNKAL